MSGFKLNQEDKSEIAELKSKLLQLQTDLMESKVKLASQEVTLRCEMETKIKEAYDNGFDRCMKQFEKMKSLMGGAF